MQVLCYNKKARFNYSIEDEIEAGIVLLGSEVKSARQGKVNIGESYITDVGEELFLVNANISEYKGANRFNHEPKRARKLLLNRKEINKIVGKLRIKGLSAVPLKMYLNNQNFIKLTVAICRGKKLYDKRETIKKRDEARYESRASKED